MKTVSFLITFCLLASFAQAKPEKYEFDKEHTTILFFVNHLGFSDKIGRFTKYEGHFIFDEENPKESSVEVTLMPTGIDTESEALNDVIQGEKWFNTKEYPEIHFKSSKVEVTDKNKADVIGWLKFLGEEKPVTLHVTFNKSGTHPITKKYIAGFSANAEINRSQFGMNNNVPFIGENVRLHIEAEGIKVE